LALSRDEKIETVRHLLGLVKRLNDRELPDDFNVTIKVRHRRFKRLDIQPIGLETTIIEDHISVK
jgi:hypothetical protein